MLKAADVESLPKTKYNVAQPENIAERENATDDGKGLDLILVPGLAFTPAGARLGRGKGYYDQYLQRCLESGIQSIPVGKRNPQFIVSMTWMWFVSGISGPFYVGAGSG